MWWRRIVIRISPTSQCWRPEVASLTTMSRLPLDGMDGTLPIDLLTPIDQALITYRNNHQGDAHGFGGTHRTVHPPPDRDV